MQVLIQNQKATFAGGQEAIFLLPTFYFWCAPHRRSDTDHGAESHLCGAGGRKLPFRVGGGKTLLPTFLFWDIPRCGCSPGPFRGRYFLAAEQESTQRSRLRGRFEQRRPPKNPPPPRQRRWGEFGGGLRLVYREFAKPTMQRSKFCQALIDRLY